MGETNNLLGSLASAIGDMEEEEAARLAHQAIGAGLDASQIIFEGVLKGMTIASDRWDSGEYFVPELLLCSDALYAALNIVRPHLPSESSADAIRVVIGVVEGDTHDIGKNLVRIMLEGSGCQILDVGRDVPPARFVEAAADFKADVIAMSTMMTTTMGKMPMVINQLVEKGIRDKYKIVVGGAPISVAYARQIGADGYARNATEAARFIKSIFSPARA